MRFKNRTVIVIGAGAGMGKAAAIAFAKEGAKVVINSITEVALYETAGEIKQAGGFVTAICGDATNPECVNKVVGTALEHNGNIDILFNYIGGMPLGVTIKSFIEDPVSDWDAFINLNLKSPLMFTRAVLPSMIRQKYGKIINTGSGAGRVGEPGMTLYSTTKGGIIAFTKAIAKEVAQYNINVNCVCPGPVETRSFMKSFEGRSEALEKIKSSIPLQRLGKSEEVADAVLFLASDEASYITGQTLSVDGGQIMI